MNYSTDNLIQFLNSGCFLKLEEMYAWVCNASFAVVIQRL
jgi:hypothetical protein